MGKFNSIFTFTGKVGEAVGMKGRDGKTYIRKDVTPKNVNTEDQQRVRTKMALAGKISSLTPASLLTGMRGGNASARRSEFVASMIKRMTEFTDPLTGEKTAMLKPADLILSQGAYVAMPTVTLAKANNTVTASATLANSGVDAIIVVAYTAEEATGDYVMCDYDVLTSSVNSVQLDAKGAVTNVYAIPVVRREGASSTAYGEAIANIEADSSYALRSNNNMASAMAYGQSSHLQSMTNA